jgi:hypothetical protein
MNPRPVIDGFIIISKHSRYLSQRNAQLMDIFVSGASPMRLLSE